MALIPYQKISFDTHLSQTKAIERFRKAVFTDSPDPKYFRGPTDYLVNISGNHFTARRLQEYIPGRKGSARIIPVIEGQFIDTPTGSILLIKMYPDFFGVLIVSGLILASLYFIFNDLQKWLSTGDFFYNGIASLLIAALSYILLVDSFDPEVKRINTFLNDLYHNKKRA